jgi:aminoglycoside/choline kinase family phosphotransferase
VDLGEELREDLLEYYRKKLIESGGFRFGEEELKYMSIIAGLQRNMQALGAFSYLSLTKGKKQFEQYIPLGLKHLKEGLMKLKAFRHKFEPLTHLEEIVIERGGS